MFRLLIVAALISLSFAAAAEEFPRACTPPLASRGKAGQVDRECGLEGNATKAEHRVQNAAKNNLCASGTPVPLTKAHFMRLQKAVDDAGIDYGNGTSLPKDRSHLRNLIQTPAGARIGEGSVVSYVGFLSHPRNSNVSKGESVNCKLTGAVNNDIHFDLLQRKNDTACDSVTAEIIPHRRSQAYQAEVLRLAQIAERPVRVTGQLFFDGSHVPCRGGKPASPQRATVWEIHPVYHIEVCKNQTIQACKITAGSDVWIPLDEFVNVAMEEEEDDEDQ